MPNLKDGQCALWGIGGGYSALMPTETVANLESAAPQGMALTMLSKSNAL